MKITDLHITDFRCFKEAHLRIAPITLVTGANSAGKSSLFAPVLAAAQTDGMPVMLSPNGRHIDMGDYPAMVHRHRRESVIGVTLEFEAEAGGPNKIASRFTYDKASGTPRLHGLSYASDYYQLSVDRNGEGYNLSYNVEPGKSRRLKALLPDSPELYAILNKLESAIHTTPEITILDPARLLIAIKNDDSLSGFHSLAQPQDFFRILHSDEILKFRVAHDVNKAITVFQENFGHLSSFRLAPERTYYEVSRANLRVGRYGENYVEQLSHWESTGSPRIDQLRTDLAELGILSELEIRRLGGGRLELAGRPKDASSPTNLADLGFGTSQLLPVLVAINQLPDGSLFTVSQPETHLHPEVQAQLADYLVRLAKERQIRFIVETHSEYLINRMRLLVADGGVAEDDVSVAYVVNDGDKAEVCPIELRADGRLMGAPAEFFDTYMMDVMKLALGNDA